MRLLSMEKDSERARELLTWIQDAIKAGKLRDPVYTETGKCDPESKEPISDSENTPSLVPQLKNDDYNPFKEQIAEIDSMLVDF
ncbi:hypothetical protein RclHR1_02650029 [Rhizophagus clarus]|uniref:Uncharacterized protein n=1 Tax=Rhizophagus clarus TaxID=94130 RepID=A0A2Z6RVF5_9GLOM|nr:hypothetical protein RclHR1_02650029 [Rhizophagus clarus]